MKQLTTRELSSAGACTFFLFRSTRVKPGVFSLANFRQSVSPRWLPSARFATVLFALYLLSFNAWAQYFTYSVNGGTVTITGYNGPGGAVIIPDMIDGLPVTAIGTRAFIRKAMTSVTIPDSVNTIGNSAFVYCAGLTSVTIGNSVTSIGAGAFYYCASLASVTIPNGVATIGDGAFQNCTGLMSVSIGQGVTTIGRGAFYRCTALTSIAVDDFNATFSSVDGVVLNKTRTTLLLFPPGKAGDYAIPDGVTSVGGHAFEHCYRLTGVTIPDSVESIGMGAFQYCVSLTNMTTGDGVAAVGDFAFYNCASLASVTIGDNVSIIGNDAFAGCGLTSLNIPNTVTSLGLDAFRSCTSLTNVTTGNGVTSIGDGAFQGCTSLASVSIGENVSTIGNNAFTHCSLTSVTIPDRVTFIGSDAFRSCTGLADVTIGSGLTTIGGFAFFDCTSLTNLAVDAANSHYSSSEGVIFNQPKTTLIICPEGKAGAYSIPYSVTSIEDLAFVSCKNLTSVMIGDAVASIGSFAFLNCINLTSISIDPANPNFSSVDGVVFNKQQTTLIVCPGGRVGSYTIPDGVTKIGDSAFDYCRGITSATVPQSVASIGNLAFRFCPGLTEVYFMGNAPIPDGSSLFHGSNQATVYYLPGTTGWEATFAGRPTVLWDPKPQLIGPTDPFAFNITASSDLVVVVEAATSLSNPDWTPVGTNTLTGGLSSFSDPDWENQPRRFYRLRSP